MAAKDYQICCALFSAYIGKQSKRNPNQMTADRKEITENEILGLIDWYVNKRSWDGPLGFEFDSHIKDGYKVEVVLKKKGGEQ